jgi:hypothetical protein
MHLHLTLKLIVLIYTKLKLQAKTIQLSLIKLHQNMIHKGVTMDHTVPHRLHQNYSNHPFPKPYNFKRILDRS